jgi:hypothetical protein
MSPGLTPVVRDSRATVFAPPERFPAVLSGAPARRRNDAHGREITRQR